MSELHHLINLYSKIEKKSIEKKEDDLILKYKTLLIENPFLEDKEASFVLYNTTEISSKFRNLKFRLKEHLYHEIFYNVSMYKSLKIRSDVHIICSKYHTILLELFDKGYIDLANKLSLNLFELSHKFELTNFSLFFLKNLIIHSSYIQPNKKLQTKYLKLRADLYHTRIIEDYSIDQYTKFSALFAHQKSGLKPEQIKELSTTVAQLIYYSKQCNSYTFMYHSSDLISFYYLQIKDYNKVMDISLRSINQFISKPFKDPKAIYINYYNIILANIYLKNHAIADTYIEKCMEIVTKGNIFWNRILAIAFINNSLCGNYSKLFSVLNEFKNFDTLKFNNQLIIEEWYIREAYVHFLMRIGKIEPKAPEKKQKNPFIISKFLNNIYFFSKDKSGQNFSILLIQILFLLQNKKYNSILDKEDSLKIYYYRYLKKDNTFRTNCLVQMILIMIKYSFNYIRIKRLTDELYTKLKSEPYNISEESAYIEIIPYEQIWELILEMLQNK